MLLNNTPIISEDIFLNKSVSRIVSMSSMNHISQLGANNIISSSFILQHFAHQVQFSSQKLLFSFRSSTCLQLTQFRRRMRELTLTNNRSTSATRRSNSLANIVKPSHCLKSSLWRIFTKSLTHIRTVFTTQISMGHLTPQITVSLSMNRVNFDNGVSSVILNYF